MTAGSLFIYCVFSYKHTKILHNVKKALTLQDKQTKYYRMKARTVMALFAAAMVVAGCGQSQKKKNIVIYYSQTGATHQVACELARMLDADTLRIDVEQPYDGTYQETIERCRMEMAGGEIPALKKELKVDLSRYDTVFLGYPIWFGTYAPPIAALIKEYDFAGKKIIPFCTFGSGGLGASIEHLKKALPQAEILPGYGVRNARIDKAHGEVERFLTVNGFLDGEVIPLPEYSDQQPVTAEEAGIFNAACGITSILSALP